jgi:Protein of unknown function (DUF4199)
MNAARPGPVGSEGISNCQFPIANSRCGLRIANLNLGALLICDFCALLWPMKIALKYGLLIAVGAMAWVLIADLTVANSQSLVHTLGTPIVFNVLQFVMIYLGLKAREREKGERQTFKEGLKTGVSISFVYALAASLFFAVLPAVGAKWVNIDPELAGAPTSRVAAAFAALFFGAMLPGLVYSTLISFFLAKRLE